MKTIPLSFEVSSQIGTVSAEIMQPETMLSFLVLAHGAGAGMNHAFMVELSGKLAQAGVGTMRYNFPFVEQGKRRPDFPAVAEKTVEAAILKSSELFPHIKILAGGKSFGGRMTSQYIAKRNPSTVAGLVFVGFPLHPPGKPSVDRAAHLEAVKIPMLFLQGTRDTLAEWELIAGVCSGLASAQLVKVENADHAFHRKGGGAMTEIVEAIVRFSSTL